ncbi:MAG: DUF2282 domain-containing protein [Dokdonella sp.]
MINQNMLRAALLGTLALGTVSIATTATAADKMKMEKCYGINAAHKNDCKTSVHSCAGQDPTARDASAFVAMPAGLCEKIDGGSANEPAKS